MDKPFWEKTYQDKDVSTFSKGPTVDLEKYSYIIPNQSIILDVGCGEGRNSIFLAKQNHIVEAFDLSKAGIEKAKTIAQNLNLNINFWAQDLKDFKFAKKYNGWEIVHHLEGTFSDEHPGGIKHEHAFERIIAKKINYC